VRKLALVILATALSGCALIEREQADVTENLLAHAGFQKRAATGGDRELPAREIATQYGGEKTRYLYADPDGCRCVYSGGEAQYERYRWLEARENLLRELNGGEMNAASLADTP
jgi:hypothetical protein